MLHCILDTPLTVTVFDAVFCLQREQNVGGGVLLGIVDLIKFPEKNITKYVKIQQIV